MKQLLAVAVVLCSLPALAQQVVSYPPGATQASIDALSASMPQPSDAIPPTDTLNGAVGASARYMREDAPRPTISQRTTVTTDASGNFTVTWAKAFVSPTPAIFLTPIMASTAQSASCTVTTRSATAVTGNCKQTSTQAVALISLTVSLTPINLTSTSVMVIGLEPSQ